MEIKVIFLDFDGVLNDANLPAGFAEGWPESHLETHLIKKINKIVKTINDKDAQKNIKTKIVISSSWRKRFTLDELKEMLQNKGLEADVIDVIPNILSASGKHIPRGVKINAWLDSSKDTVVGFVILDDVYDMEHLKLKLVHINDATGITDEDVEKAIKILQY